MNKDEFRGNLEVHIYIYTRINGLRIRAATDSSLDLDPLGLVEKHLSRSFLRRKMSLLMVLSGVQSTVSRHSGAARKVFEPGRQGEEPQNFPLTPLQRPLASRVDTFGEKMNPK